MVDAHSHPTHTPLQERDGCSTLPHPTHKEMNEWRWLLVTPCDEYRFRLNAVLEGVQGVRAELDALVLDDFGLVFQDQFGQVVVLQCHHLLPLPIV